VGGGRGKEHDAKWKRIRQEPNCREIPRNQPSIPILVGKNRGGQRRKSWDRRKAIEEEEYALLWQVFKRGSKQLAGLLFVCFR